MKTTGLVSAVLFSAAALCHETEQEKKQQSETTPTTKPNYDMMASALLAFADSMSFPPLFASPTVTLGLDNPRSLPHQIMTAVLMPVVAQLVRAAPYRESVASDFQAGTTPGWCEELEPGMKTFFRDVAAEIKTGGAVVTRSSETDSTPVATATGAAD